jgi:UDP-N-acetylmuramoyl-tripeptide--D-alanyl-D-alanine ligase
VPFSESAKIAEKSALLPGRMKIINGIKNSTIIDDSYNSSPIAARQALNALSRIETNGRKIAVMGDMLELGRFSADEHKSLAGPIKSAASFAVCVGIRARRTGEELLSLGFPQESLACFDTSLEAGEFLKNEIKNGDIVLVKGSQNMRMERTVEAIMRHPEDKEKFLVRQEPEWLERK